MNYRVGWPFWKTVAKMGFGLSIRINAHWDNDVGAYWADSSDLQGLIVEGKSTSCLISEVLRAGHCLLELELGRPLPTIKFNIVFPK